jgi:hypothetical protein
LSLVTRRLSRQEQPIAGELRLDAIYFGTSDLAGSMGLPPEAAHPSLDEAIATVIRKARQRGVCVGQSPEDDVKEARQLIDNGVQSIAVGDDFRLLANSVDRLVNGILGSRSSVQAADLLWLLCVTDPRRVRSFSVKCVSTADGTNERDEVRLVKNRNGKWSWPFGRNRDFVEAKIGRFDHVEVGAPGP